MNEIKSGQDINSLMIKGTSWVIALRLVLKLLGIISIIILARLLVPEDFGIIALATVIAAYL